MNGKEPLVATSPAYLPKLTVPILFFPGIMATRLQTNRGGLPIWEPDNEWWMFLSTLFSPNWLKKYMLGISGMSDDFGGSKPKTNDPGIKRTFYSKEQLKRGFGECYNSFEEILKKMDKEFYGKTFERRSVINALNIDAPVEVIGYDFRKQPKEIVEDVKIRFDELKNKYQTKDIPPDKVPFIIVTHSMGGLIARKLLQKYKDLEKQVLGVIHGNQPAVGSPKFYGYFKKGAKEVNLKTINRGGLDHIKERVLSAAMGSTAMEFQNIVSDVPGALILLPTNDYAKKKWLTCDFKKNGPVIEKIKEAMKKIDDTDYAERGEINPNKSIYDYYNDESGYIGLLDSNFEKKYDEKIAEDFIKSVKSAEKFHQQIGEGDNFSYIHPHTYEISSSEYNTVQGVKLTEKDKEVKLSPHSRSMERIKIVKEFHADLDFSNDGDGTVPLSSQQALSNRYKAEGSFLFNRKVAHQDSYTPKEIMDYTCDTIEEILLREFSSVYFAQDSSEINDENKKRLERLINVIIMMDIEGKKYNYMVKGYASYEGDRNYNLRLSKERAESVVNYLAEKLSKRKLTSETKSEEERKKEYKKRFEIEFKGATIKAGEQRNQETKERWRRVDIRRKLN